MTYLVQESDSLNPVDHQDMTEMHEMMVNAYPRKNAVDYGGGHHLLGVTTWVVFVALLVAATRYLWMKAEK